TLITSNDAEWIRMVLLNPEDTFIESANFRHWVKNSFTLSNNQIPKQYIKICPMCSPVLSEPLVPALKVLSNVVEFDKRMASYTKHLPDEFRDKATISWSMTGKIEKTLLDDTTEPVKFQLKFTEPPFMYNPKDIYHRDFPKWLQCHKSAHTLAMKVQPYHCEHINPSTGKPCNSILSSPRSLRRHEDEIHNTRKQKVRCCLCTKEKTFSRNDNLAHHMRVFHPEVDWPGKRKCKSTYS
ncbi:predicted protein, partial [Histoplasma mississippiense (nom. inval.)]|uniref:predicted protein n=1 Tax=Ajellomyces capsulatus (strain NAm1 / WU24) TaxID=2059318 RepID=UPI000157D647